jgi:hypothetical protein
MRSFVGDRGEWCWGCRLGMSGTLDEGYDVGMTTKILHIHLNIRALRAVIPICLLMNGSNSWDLCGLLMYGLLMVSMLLFGGEGNVTDIASDGRLLTMKCMLVLQI